MSLSQFYWYWCLTTLNISDGSFVYDETNIGERGRADCLLDNSNNLIVSGFSGASQYDIFNGNCLYYNSQCINYQGQGHEKNNLIAGNSNDFYRFSNDQNYTIENFNVGSPNSSNLSYGFQTDASSSPAGLDLSYHSYKTDFGFSLGIEFNKSNILIFNQLFLKDKFNHYGSYLFLDVDSNFNILNSFLINPMCNLHSTRFAASNNGKKCVFFEQVDGSIIVNGTVYSGNNKKNNP